MAIEINGTTGISGVDGSAATPALQGADTNTGISFGTDEVSINTGGTERVKVDSSGQVGIGTSSPNAALTVDGTAGNAKIRLGQGGDHTIIGPDSSGHTVINAGTSGGNMQFQTAGTERMRINSAGRTKFAMGSFSDNSVEANSVNGGIVFNADSGSFAQIAVANNSGLSINRISSDGYLLRFAHAGSMEGQIVVSGTTVSLSGGHLSRWSQLPGNAERTEILRGSVLSNLDEMCEWAYEAKDAVLYTEDDELPEGVSVGDVKEPARDAGTEDNEQLNRMQVSSVEGDPNVSGVFQSWDDDDDTYTNDFYCAMTGDFVIRIAQGTTVARGDLLMSAGDGTAKPQDDDIVRSKTIAKVTSTNVSCTYDDGSYCVPCVLMAC